MDAQALLDTLDLGVVVIAPDWTIAQWSAAASRITGLTADRVLGRTFWVAFPTARGTHVEQVLQDVLADGQPRTILAPARPEFPALVFETRVTRGPRNHLVMAFRQVREELPPESRAAQLVDAFETERRLYVQLFASLPTPALVLAADGQILDANPEGARLLGVSEVLALRGRALADWAPAAERAPLAAGLRDAITRRQELRFTVEFAGEPARDVHAVVVNVDPARAVPTLLLAAVDVSRELLLQRRLLQADRLSQLGALVSGVAHELNNPLAAIAAFAELLAVDPPQQTDLKESAEIIRCEAMRAGRIVRTLLDFARQRPRMEVAVDLAEIVERVLALQRSAFKKARVRVVVSLPDDLPVVTGDPQELQQVFLNAVVNARQAIDGTGRPGQITIAAGRTDHHVLVTVDDTGPGVPPELLERVFEPFFTTKGEQGTGLGLAISFGLVRTMGGRMWIQNVEGGGARLSFELPMDTAPAASPAPTPFQPAARPLSVFVVDDEEGVRRGMVLLAKRLGHEVTSVADFASAAQHLAAPGARFDAVLLDVHLDEDHTGFDLFERLRLAGRGQERRIVFTTGDSISPQTRDALQRSERPVLRKPFSLEELREMLERVASG